jgi:hypothetical protein
LEVSPFISAETLISKVTRGIEVPLSFSPQELGIYFPQFSCWVSGSTTLVELARQSTHQQLQVHIRLRPRQFVVGVAVCVDDHAASNLRMSTISSNLTSQESPAAESASNTTEHENDETNSETSLTPHETESVETDQSSMSISEDVSSVVADSASAAGTILESQNVKIKFQNILIDVGVPIAEGVLPVISAAFDLSPSGSFRVETLRNVPVPISDLSELENFFTANGKLNSFSKGLELLPSCSASIHPLDLSRPLSIQAIQSSDVLLFQYLPPTQDDDEEGGCNIWDEPPSSEENVLYEEVTGKDGVVTHVLAAATLNRLVEVLTSEEKVNVEFLDAFLLTYQSFTTPFIFLNKLIQRFNVPYSSFSHLSQEEFYFQVQNPIRVRVCNVLRKWIELTCDELPDELLSRITEFAQSMAADKNGTSLAKIINNSIRKGKERKAHFVQFDDRPPPPILPRSLYDESLSILDVDEEEIARQISIVDFDHFRCIKPPELLNQAWAKTKLQYRARNVLKMIAWFNHISKLTAYLILSTEPIKTRAKVMAKLIQVAKFARQYNNFGAVMGIISGFNNASILRLKLTQSHIPKKSLDTLAELEELMSSLGSYRNYRAAMEQANPPLIPYMGVHLSDLTFIEDGNPDKMGNLINFGKRKLVSKVISQLQRYQPSPYNLETVPRIIKLISKTISASDDELYQLSLLREPRTKAKK